MRILFILSIFVMLSCKGKSNETIKQTKENNAPSTSSPSLNYIEKVNIVTPHKHQQYHIGDKITISFNSKEQIDSTIINIDNIELVRLSSNTKEYTLDLPSNKLGNRTIKLTSYHPNNNVSIAYTNIEILAKSEPKLLDYKIVATYPHDPKAYTQGLAYHNNTLYEGTGQYGQSSLRKVDIASGKVLSILNLERRFFGEGISIHEDKIYQVTWQSRTGFVYDLNTFQLLTTFTYNTQGWGLSTIDKQLILSDGSHKLYYLNPNNFSITQTIEVYDNKDKITNLNELEYINGILWANIWLTDTIIGINPNTGEVLYKIDLSKLLTPQERSKLDMNDEVLNGIAYNPDKGTFYLTGKYWTKLFEISITLP